MTDDIDFPASMTGRELDDYLSRGWYRMWQFIFTTDFWDFNGYTYAVYWLRIALPKVEYGKSQKKILRRNKKFTLEIKPFMLSPEIEELFGLYRTSIDFKTTDSLTGYFMAGAIDNVNIFNTQLIEIRDGSKLIAAGFFDLGETSIAG